MTATPTSQTSRVKYVTDALLAALMTIGNDGSGNWLTVPKGFYRASEFPGVSIAMPAIFLHIAEVKPVPRSGVYQEHVVYRIGILATHPKDPDQALHDAVRDVRRLVRQNSLSRLGGAVATGWISEMGYEAFPATKQGGAGLSGGIVTVEARFTTDQFNP